MGKKKKNKDIWDLTAEEQLESCEDFFKFETTGNILDIGDNKIKKKKKDKVNDNGLTSDLEKRIYSEISGVDAYRVDESYNEEKTYSDKKTISYSDFEKKKNDNRRHYDYEKKEQDKKSVSYFNKGIKVRVYDKLNRMVINDGISPTTVSFNYLDWQPLVNSSFDADYLSSVITNLFYYIITLKHPMAILTKGEFVNKFQNYKSIDVNKFFICSKDDWIMLYFISEEDSKKLLSIPDNYGFDDELALKYFITLAYNAGSTHNAFLVEDDEYLEAYREFKSADDFIGILNNDKETEYYQEDEEKSNIYERLSVLDVTLQQKVARKILIKLTGEDDDDDDYDTSFDNDEYIETREEDIMNKSEVIGTRTEPVEDLDDYSDEEPDNSIEEKMPESINRINIPDSVQKAVEEYSEFDGLFDNENMIQVTPEESEINLENNTSELINNISQDVGYVKVDVEEVVETVNTTVEKVQPNNNGSFVMPVMRKK